MHIVGHHVPQYCIRFCTFFTQKNVCLKTKPLITSRIYYIWFSLIFVFYIVTFFVRFESMHCGGFTSGENSTNSTQEANRSLNGTCADCRVSVEFHGFGLPLANF